MNRRSAATALAMLGISTAIPERWICCSAVLEKSRHSRIVLEEITVMHSKDFTMHCKPFEDVDKLPFRRNPTGANLSRFQR